MRVAGCGGATRPAVGESDWGCWDCAAASRTGCPDGLAVRDDTQPHAAEHGDSNTHTHTHVTKDTKATHQDREMWGRWTRREDRTDKKAREGGRVEGRQERSESRHKKFSPRGKSKKQRGLWERQRVPWKPTKKKETRGEVPEQEMKEADPQNITKWRNHR